jgi:hypothetical protein
MFDSVELVEQLLNAGADPTARDWTNAGALDYAYDEIVFEVISRAMFPKVETRDREALAWLKQYGGRWKGQNAWESTGLSRAIGQMDGGVVPPPPPPPLLSPTREAEGTSAPREFYRAAGESRMLGRVRTLIRIGADPNERASRAGADWTPLGMAMKNGALRVARFLLQHGADPNQRWCVNMIYGSFSGTYPDGAFSKHPSCNQLNGVTPLMNSSAVGDPEQVQLLMEFNADAARNDWAGRTALDYATTPEVRALLQRR